MQEWAVEFHWDFVPEFRALPHDVRKRLLAILENLKIFGPELGRPEIDRLTVGGNVKHKNLKEIRSGRLIRFGASPLPSTRAAARLCCAAAPKGGPVKVGFTGV
jgi:hypothetical protein